MKLIATADVHCHTHVPFSTAGPEGINSRLYCCLEALQAVYEYAVANEILHVIIAGDLFHLKDRIPVEVYVRVWELLHQYSEQKGIQTIIVPGNHDGILQTGRSCLTPLHKKTAFVFEKPDVLAITDDILISGIPFYRDVEQTKEAVKFVISEIQSIDREFNFERAMKILVGHVGVFGAAYGDDMVAKYEELEATDLRPDFFDFVVLGHLHKHQMVRRSQTRKDDGLMFYTGTPLQHTFSDEGVQGGFVVIDTDVRTVEHIPLHFPEFRTARVQPDGMMLGDFPPMDITPYEPEHYYRLVVKDDVPDEVIERTITHLNPIAYRIERQIKVAHEKRLDVTPGMRMEDMIIEYVSAIADDSMDTKRLCKMGIEQWQEGL